VEKLSPSTLEHKGPNYYMTVGPEGTTSCGQKEFVQRKGSIRGELPGPSVVCAKDRSIHSVRKEGTEETSPEMTNCGIDRETTKEESKDISTNSWSRLQSLLYPADLRGEPAVGCGKNVLQRGRGGRELHDLGFHYGFSHASWGLPGSAVLEKCTWALKAGRGGLCANP